MKPDFETGHRQLCAAQCNGASWSTTPSSDGIEHDIAPDALLELEIEFNNQGNRLIVFQPYVRSIPGGWEVLGGLYPASIPAGETAVWPVSLQGNGVAVSGDLELRFATEDGYYVDWNRDRKSTRLNSSHALNSYAVFCLKKKTIYHSSLSYS